jgi:hypothetical protein
MNWPLVIAGGMSLVGAAIHGIVGDLFLRKVARRSVALDEVSEAFKPADLPVEQASRYQLVINNGQGAGTRNPGVVPAARR